MNYQKYTRHSTFQMETSFMLIRCPHCDKWNRLNSEKLDDFPICGSCKKDLLTKPINLDSDSVNSLLKSSKKPILIDFWAPWCGPCRMFAPTFESSSEKYVNDVIHAKIDTEENYAAGQQFNIRSIPTLVGFKNGVEINRVSGALPPKELEQFIHQLISQ